MLYVLWVSIHNHYSKFRYAEIESILHRLTSLSQETLWGPDKMPSWMPQDAVVTRPGDTEKIIFLNLDPIHEHALVHLTQESVSVKWSGRVLARGATEDEMVADAQNINIEQFQQEIRDRGSFAFFCDTHNKSVTMQENVNRMNRLSFLFTKKEKANLENPGLELLLLEDCLYQARDDPKPWQCVASVLAVAVARKGGQGPSWRRYDLPARPVLGPTSLDNDLATILVHMGGIADGMLVLDPFCGTGGILISATHRGGTCLGSDLDARVLRGWGVAHCNDRSEAVNDGKANIFQNFTHYGLARPEAVRADNSHSPWRPRGVVDIIITDPPYGIRAMARQASSAAPLYGPLISTVARQVDAIIRDLLLMAANVLIKKGRLIFLLPVNHDTRSEQLAEVLEFATLTGTTLCVCW
eukprot:Gregarina_sp_Poly_1__6664@NODE_358_length_9258_cov_311_740398_g297_i0_p2_GENE_NODE_358_length_9258_cov_311_740398_g297_i0NODE_358_length_9258_cov_311_740398_g297_i0_p2_ORF_typecomplete_len412_score34_12UPF0020/PF01170_18/4_2e27N6_N4_Mtase/PF01555_18/0_00051N6_N4_Mtase/PF01555_18/0_89N6_Mtase/PF02384_16/4e07MTS/PF05175_14/1_4e05Cons_hypoth95/PF03602_15/0_00045AviRa/PF11599_8/0_55AviRa/PF11599_8/4_2Methyltransf_15/PF09445_10/0_012N6adenineMlase/PF10237_9/0_021MethyltransfD12/PF02086_15/0_069Methyl